VAHWGSYDEKLLKYPCLLRFDRIARWDSKQKVSRETPILAILAIKEMRCEISSIASTLTNLKRGSLHKQNAFTAQNTQAQVRVQKALSQRNPPKELDLNLYVEIHDLWKKLQQHKIKIVDFAGENQNKYELCLSTGFSACIDARGRIYFGIDLLRSFQELSVLIGILAHEIGHRPHLWGRYRTGKQLSRAQLNAICRKEEAIADYFCGQVLAEEQISVEPNIQFLQQHQILAHPKYLPASKRAEIIWTAWSNQQNIASTRKQLWPSLDKKISLHHILGEF